MKSNTKVKKVECNSRPVHACQRPQPSRTGYSPAFFKTCSETCVNLECQRRTLGVRAQAISPEGELVQDFLFIARPNALHVLNAPSPAATAALAIGAEIAAMAEQAATG
jgi:L-2-hydroxyglutarate oxidase